MGEIVSFAEGSAQFATGDGSFATQLYVRSVRLRMERQSTRYRPPYSTPYTHVDYQNPIGSVSMVLAEGPDSRALKSMLANAAPGSLHCHVFGLIGAAGALGSAGFYGYSGTLDAGELAGSDGEGEQQFSVEGWLQSWSAY